MPRTEAVPSEAPILTSDDGSIRVITLNRPKRLNAFTPESYRLLTSALRDAGADASVHVVLLTGAGRAFSSGVDLQVLADAGSDTSEFTAAFDGLVETLAAFPKPLIATVHGVAVGFGFTLLLHCDLVLTATDARLRAPFTALGTTPEAASSWLLPRLVGAARASDLLLTSRWLSGEEAVELGLAARCCPVESLAATAREVAHEIAALSPSAVAATKALIREGWVEHVRAAMLREREIALRSRPGGGPLGAPR